MKTVIAAALIATLSGGAVLVADGTVPEVAGTVESVGTLGIGGTLLVMIGRLSARVTAWLDSLDKHHAAVQLHNDGVVQHNKQLRRSVRELVSVLRRAHGIPDPVVRDFTPLPDEPDEASPGRRRGVEPR